MTSPPKKPRRRLRTIEKFIILLILLGAGATLLLMRYTDEPVQTEVHATESTIQKLKMAVTEYKLTTGKHPQTLDELVHGPRNYLKEGTLPTDAWGHPFTYYLKEDVVMIRSAGPDGIIDTDDDVDNN